MIISKELIMDEKLPSGLYPVRIVVEHNSRSYSIDTGVTINARMWDNNLKMVTAVDPMAEINNELINSQLRRIAGKIQTFIDNQLNFGLEQIFNGTDTKIAGSSLTLDDVVAKKMISIRNLNTRRGYTTFRRYLISCFGEKYPLNNFNQILVNQFINKLEEDYPDNIATRHLLTSKMISIYNFACRSNLMEHGSDISFPKFKYRPCKRSLSPNSIKIIFDIYNRSKLADPEFRSAGTFALGLFILDIAFQGLAPVDLALLKIGQIEFIDVVNESDKNPENKISSIRAIRISTMRKKTGEPVKIIAAEEYIRDFLRILIKDKDHDDYLIPCFDSKLHYTENSRQNRLSNYFHKHAHHLRRELQANINSGDSTHFSKLTYYYARHAFCNLADSLDLPRHQIQTLVGHSYSVLERSYLRELTEWEQAQISKKLLSQFL